jgi:hypothetical protein
LTQVYDPTGTFSFSVSIFYFYFWVGRRCSWVSHHNKYSQSYITTRKKKKKKKGKKNKKKKRKELSKEWYLLLLTVSQFQTRDGQLNPLYFPKAQENQSGRQNACTSWGLKKK